MTNKNLAVSGSLGTLWSAFIGAVISTIIVYPPTEISIFHQSDPVLKLIAPIAVVVIICVVIYNVIIELIEGTYAYREFSIPFFHVKFRMPKSLLRIVGLLFSLSIIAAIITSASISMSYLTAISWVVASFLSFVFIWNMIPMLSAGGVYL